jgi:hypothetical protein
MGCIILQAEDGTKRSIPTGTHFRLQPGEKMVGNDPFCKDGEMLTGLGDIIKVLAGPIAIAIGKENCPPCKARQKIFNAYGKLAAKVGYLPALKMMWELCKIAKNDPTAALVKLNEYES